MRYPIAGRDYFNVKTKSAAINFLQRFTEVSKLRKIPKHNIMGMYHEKMGEVLRKRGDYAEVKQTC